MRLITIAVVGVLGLAVGLGIALLLMREVPPNLTRAKSVTIFYGVGVGHPGPNRRLVVPEPAKLLSMLDLESTQKGAALGLWPSGTLEVELPDGSKWHCMIAGPHHLELGSWGQLYLKTSRFYDEVNALASAHEGRPIDVLKDN